MSTSAKSQRFFKIRRIRLLIIAVLFFVGSIIYFQAGGSVHTKYNNTESPVEVREHPQNFTLPFNNLNFTGGFNSTELPPGFEIPPGLIGRIPPGEWGDWPLPTPGPLPPPSTDPSPLPPIPTLPPLPDPDPTFPGPGGPPQPGPGPIEGNPNVTGKPPGEGGFDTSDKARNLPSLDFLKLDWLNLDFINLNSMMPKDVKAVSYFILIFSGIFVSNNFIPLFLRKMDEFGEYGLANSGIFFVQKRLAENEKQRIERIRRLMAFSDHVDELVIRSRERIIEQTASKTIIIGYHELDTAFSDFANLERSKDITPLEHANSHFEKDEMDTDVLVDIVDLFYLTRYGRKEIERKYGYEFIELLEKLVITPDIKQIN